MLRELRVRNLAVVDGVTVGFTGGLNVLTGETGAGKSILVDAILLVRGARAQADAIRTGSDVATVEAVFAVPPHSAASALLHEAGLAADENGEVVVRRELTRAGRHRAFLNDSPVSVGLLERLGDQLVEVHGQHEHQRLLEPGHQLILLDRFAEADALRERVAGLVAGYREAGAAAARMRAAARDRAQREDLLRFQVGELDGAGLRPGEEAALRDELRRLEHAERFRAALADVAALLADDPQSAADRLARAARSLADVARLDEAFAAPLEALETARIHVDETLDGVRRLRDRTVHEPGRIDAIHERLDALARLKRKYGESEEGMLAFREAAALELARVERHDELLADQERLLTELAGELRTAADELSQRRRAAADRLAPRVERQLRALGMERAAFAIAVEPGRLEEVSERGLDRVEFRLAANPGEGMRPLARVASGGELSRAMLALKAVLARADGIPTLVFDEVDAGIGARVAAVVGETLAAAAEGRQVLCVTHLAAIAARADHHLHVAKSTRGGRTRVTVETLTDRARLSEVARMLGGVGNGAAAVEHARALLAARGRPSRTARD